MGGSSGCGRSVLCGWFSQLRRPISKVGFDGRTVADTSGFCRTRLQTSGSNLNSEKLNIKLNKLVKPCFFLFFQAANILFSSIYFACYVISSLMAFATVVAYLLVWETHNIHGWCIGTFSACELLHFVSFAIAHGARRFSHHEIMLESAACYVNCKYGTLSGLSANTLRAHCIKSNVCL